MESFDYNEDAALELFAACGLHDILIQVAKVTIVETNQDRLIYKS